MVGFTHRGQIEAIHTQIFTKPVTRPSKLSDDDTTSLVSNLSMMALIAAADIRSERKGNRDG